ncbi:MAG: fused MFS/spermidine synthase [Anaerolineae bacterium]|nr:fused MFS/spermidine synthase [Thermoflexales bacterium]MDW8407272.1 fused MFS/spermidine synthase [Anaerolineae bacterium]
MTTCDGQSLPPPTGSPSSVAPARVELSRKDWLWQPSLIVFISNACIMTIELVAGRLVAPYVGVSLYTWTSIIGVILAGISVGNYIGGRVADRLASRRMLGLLFALAGLGSFSILGTVTVFGEAGLPRIAGLPLVARMALYFASIFFLPSALLGAISPLVVKLTLQDLSKTGGVIGRIYAASALGSILGTFATGYFLIQWFGTRAILLGVGVILLVIALLIGQWTRRGIVPAIVALGVIAAPFVFPVRSILAGPCLRETNYFCIKVREDIREDRVTYMTLILDRLVHSYTALENPTKLAYGYEKVGAEVLEYVEGRDGRLSTFFIGGGGYTLPKYVEYVYPDSTIDVAEIDPGVTLVAHELLGLRRDTLIRTFNEDARLVLTHLDEAQRYNFVMGDAFNDFSVPYHLTTHEFNQLVRRHLTDDGIYMLNLIDGPGQSFVGAFLRTLRRTFDHLYLIPTGHNWQTLARNTYVILASPAPINLEKLRHLYGGDAQLAVDDWLVSEGQLRAVMGNGVIILTDDYAPTDRLLAPMFEASEAW